MIPQISYHLSTTKTILTLIRYKEKKNYYFPSKLSKGNCHCKEAFFQLLNDMQVLMVVLNNSQAETTIWLRNLVCQHEKVCSPIHIN